MLKSWVNLLSLNLLSLNPFALGFGSPRSYAVVIVLVSHAHSFGVNKQCNRAFELDEIFREYPLSPLGYAQQQNPPILQLPSQGAIPSTTGSPVQSSHGTSSSPRATQPQQSAASSTGAQSQNLPIGFAHLMQSANLLAGAPLAGDPASALAGRPDLFGSYLEFFNEFHSPYRIVREKAVRRADDENGPHILSLTKSVFVNGIILDGSTTQTSLIQPFISIELEDRLLLPHELNDHVSKLLPPLNFRGRSQLNGVLGGGDVVAVDIDPANGRNPLLPAGKIRIFGGKLGAEGLTTILPEHKLPYVNKGDSVIFGRAAKLHLSGTDFHGIFTMSGPTVDLFTHFITGKYAAQMQQAYAMKYTLILRSQKTLRELMATESGIRNLEKFGFKYDGLVSKLSMDSHIFIISHVPFESIYAIDRYGSPVVHAVAFNPNP